MPHTYEKILQAIGEASMCWSETPKGVFLRERAVDIAKRLYLDVIGVAPQNIMESANLHPPTPAAQNLPLDCVGVPQDSERGKLSGVR